MWLCGGNGKDEVRAMELLAPAGGKEQLEYAIRFGADAVYLACERFGMRKRASNFKVDDLPWVSAYAHERGAAVHVACNTVMHEGDLKELPAYFEAVQKAGVDALIISDMGAFALAKRYAPEVDLHVSTQASVSNSAAALAWHELGARRVVCAREMSLADIAAMHADLPDSLELEVFAHGSMCMSYSGRCIISDFLNGRPANGGHCTQPCRWEWKLEEPSRPGETFTLEEDERATYLFSSRDLNMLEHLKELEAAGVDSIKLEGRGRGAFYAATVTGAYRRVLDGEDPVAVASELETVSHHPYGTGFFFGPAHQAPYLRQSQSEWMWVAEVLGCEQVDEAGETGETAALGDDEPGSGAAGAAVCADRGETGAAARPACEGAPAAGEAPASNGAPACEGAPEASEAPAYEGAPACSEVPVYEGAPTAGEVPACEGASEAGAVPACEGAPAYRVTFRARNRFDCASELEVLSPGRASEALHVRDLRWLPAGADGEGLDGGAVTTIPVDAVTRQMETYLMTCDRPLRPHDIVRARRKPSEMPPE